MNCRKWNVVVLGSGPAGCATALALARKNVSGVCIIDPIRSSVEHLGETLPPDIRVVLDKLGLWYEFLGENHEESLGSCSSWGTDYLGYNDFVLNPYGKGWHLDRGRFDNFLRRAARSSGISFISRAKLTDSRSDGRDGFRLELAAHDRTVSSLTTRYVADATGTRCAFARRAGARRVLFDTLTFIYGFFDALPNASVSRLTMIEAVNYGWWYLVALPGRRLAVALATDVESVRELSLSIEDRWFSHVLQTRHIAPRLDNCRLISGSLATRAAPSFLLDHTVGDRWLAVGDAAASYDPLSSQGVYKALEDGLRAAGFIAAALASDSEISPDYGIAIAGDFDDYQANRSYIYGLEKRRASLPFWRRRLERMGLRAA